MTDPTPLRADEAAQLNLGELHTDFILPICLPDPELNVGEAFAGLVRTAVEGRHAGDRERGP